MTVIAIAIPTLILCEAACMPATTTAPEDDSTPLPPKKEKTPPPESTKPPTIQKADAGSSSGGSQTCETVPPNNKCGLEPQCGCLETETCDVTNRTNGATSCVTGGSATLGRPCNQTGDCMAGLGCLYGACRPYCKTDLSKCTVGGTELCVSMPDDKGVPIPNLTFCTLSCDPREPTGVCGTNSCHWFADLYAPNKVSDCNFAGPKAVLEVCETSADCKPGLACIAHPTAGLECEKWCRVGNDADCASVGAAFKCKDVYGDTAPVIGGVKEGICQD